MFTCKTKYTMPTVRYFSSKNAASKVQFKIKNNMASKGLIQISIICPPITFFFGGRGWGGVEKCGVHVGRSKGIAIRTMKKKTQLHNSLYLMILK